MNRKSKRDVLSHIAAFCSFSPVFSSGEGNQQTCANPTNCLGCSGYTLADEFPGSDDPDTILENVDLQQRNEGRARGFRVMSRPHRKSIR